MNAKHNIGNEMIKSMQDAIKYVRKNKKKGITHKVLVPDVIDVKEPNHTSEIVPLRPDQ